jgi:aminocarboxymuconate-semialdehyde decarboxylase
MPPAPRIDVHTHILPPELPNWAERFGYPGFVRLRHLGRAGVGLPCRAEMLRDDGSVFRVVGENCWDPTVRLQECDTAGVQVQVLSTVPVLFAYHAKAQHGRDVARFLNDHMATTCRDHGGRFLGLGTVPLQDCDLACRELERCVRELGLCGVEIGTHVGPANLDDDGLRGFWHTAEALDAAVFVHPWDMLAPERMARYWLPWLVGMPAELAIAVASLCFGGVFERHPRLRVLFAHGGGGFLSGFGRMEHGYTSRPDLCATHNPHPPSHDLGCFWVDALVHDPRLLRLALDVYGADRVCVGSDYPFPLGEALAGQGLDALPDLPEAVKDRVRWDNAVAWLGRAIARP